MNRQIRAFPVAVLVAAGLLVDWAAAREPAGMIPDDVLIGYVGRPMPDLPELGTGPSTIESLVALGSQWFAGEPGAQTQWWLRGAELFALTIRHEHALALLDISAEPVPERPGVVRVAQMKLALAVKLPGDKPDAAPFLRIIQKVVNEQTDRSQAALATRRAGEWSFQELRDRRLPPWCTLAWGRIDNCFVLTIGEGAWAAVADTAAGRRVALDQEPWYSRCRTWRAGGALIEVFVAVQRMRERLDALVDGRVGQFFDAWQAGRWERIYWSLGLEGRALFCEAAMRAGDEEVRRVYADPSFMESLLESVVPGDARFAVYRRPVGRLLGQIASSVLAVLSPDERDALRAVWTRAATGEGVDVERDLLAQLGERIVLVNDPPHPLRIPVAVTSLSEIRGDAAAVRRAVNHVCEVFQDALVEQQTTTRPAALAWSLHREDDGVWYVQVGPLAGPAWTVTERFIVTSWSPAALRQYLANVGNGAGGSTSRPAR